jgi:hypothetical protein
MASVAETKERVQRILIDDLGRVEIDNEGFMYRSGSTKVFIRISSFDEDNFTLVAVYAFPLLDVTYTPDVYKWVALHADSYRFGHIGLSPNEGTPDIGAIVFSHNLLGDFLDPEELKWVIGAVGSTPDRLDDELKPMFGGRRYIEDE